MSGLIKTVGTVHDRFRKPPGLSQIGEAKGDNFKYELSIDKGGAPVVRSSLTGKYFSLTWGEIMNLAIIAGINEKE